MICSPHLLKIMGTNLATEFVREPKIPDQRLYQAVIIQAFEDCLYTLGGKQEAYYKKDAHEWFLNKSPDFEKICYMAGLEPDMVHRRYKRCLEETIYNYCNMAISLMKFNSYIFAEIAIIFSSLINTFYRVFN